MYRDRYEKRDCFCGIKLKNSKAFQIIDRSLADIKVGKNSKQCFLNLYSFELLSKTENVLDDVNEMK